MIFCVVRNYTNTHLERWETACLFTPTLYARYISTRPTKGRWVTSLQALKLGQAGESPEGWMGHGQYSRDLHGSKDLVQVQASPRALYDVFMCMHDESPLLACKINAREPWPYLVLTMHTVRDRGAAINYIIRHTDDVLVCVCVSTLPTSSWQTW